MLNRKILLIVVGLLLAACGTEQQDDEGGPGFEGTWEPLPNLELSEYGLYTSFDANERYLAWIEMYENQVFVYDLNADTLECVDNHKSSVTMDATCRKAR